MYAHKRHVTHVKSIVPYFIMGVVSGIVVGIVLSIIIGLK